MGKMGICLGHAKAWPNMQQLPKPGVRFSCVFNPVIQSSIVNTRFFLRAGIQPGQAAGAQHQGTAA